MTNRSTENFLHLPRYLFNGAIRLDEIPLRTQINAALYLFLASEVGKDQYGN
jgi:hypothetical protein